MKIAFLYEHPTWSEKLIDCFHNNDINLQLINIDELTFDTDSFDIDFDLLINRVNVMPYEKRDSAIVFHTLHFLNWLELSGVRIINGARTHYIGSSKVVQNGIFSMLNLDTPRAIAIYKNKDALKAAEKIGFPVIIKPNIGGSGSNIARFNSSVELKLAIDQKLINLGVDGSGLVQKYIYSDGYVYRVEILGDELFYSTKQKIVENKFNYCATKGCNIDTRNTEQEEEFDFCVFESSHQIQLHDVPQEILQQVIKIIKKTSADFGGIEYIINRETGKPCYFDFNPYSNFVSHGETFLGFSPEQRFVDFIKNLC